MADPLPVLRRELAHVHPLGGLLRRQPLRAQRRRLLPEVAQVTLETVKKRLGISGARELLGN